MSPKKLALIAGSVALLLIAALGGVYLGTRLGGSPGPGQAAVSAGPTGSPTTAAAAGVCGPRTTTTEPGTVTEPPPAQWEELAAKDATALGPLVVPRTTVGGPFPATDGSTIPKCFAPNPTGALTAGYYMWAMTDARLPLETRKAFLEATVAQDDEGRDEYIQTTLNSPVRIHITGIRLSAPVANNTAVVEVALEYQGRRIIAHSPMYWSGDTWVTGTYTETAPVEGPLFRWAP